MVIYMIIVQVIIYYHQSTHLSSDTGINSVEIVGAPIQEAYINSHERQ